MNQNDRTGLKDLSEKIEALTKGLGTLEYLGKPTWPFGNAPT